MFLIRSIAASTSARSRCGGTLQQVLCKEPFVLIDYKVEHTTCRIVFGSTKCTAEVKGFCATPEERFLVTSTVTEFGIGNNRAVVEGETRTKIIDDLRRQCTFKFVSSASPGLFSVQLSDYSIESISCEPQKNKTGITATWTCSAAGKGFCSHNGATPSRPTLAKSVESTLALSTPQDRAAIRRTGAT